MKFAKYLQDEIVPEWRKAYINYKQGKKYLKAIERALAAEEAAAEAAHREQQQQLHDLDQQLSNAENNNNVDNDVESGRIKKQYSPELDQVGLKSFPSSTSTPIIHNPRGKHVRNYSAIIISPPNSNPESGSSGANSVSGGKTGLDETITPHNQIIQIEMPASATTMVAGLPSPIPRQNQPDPTKRRAVTTYTPNSGGGTPSPGALSLNPLAANLTRAGTGAAAAAAQGSQMLKNFSRRFTIMNSPQMMLGSRVIHTQGNTIESAFEQLLPQERAFFLFLDSQLEMVNAFYKGKELEAVTKLKVIKQQILVADEWKRRYDQKMAKIEAERGWYHSEWSRMRKGIDEFIRPDTSAAQEDVVIRSQSVSVPHQANLLENSQHGYISHSSPVLGKTGNGGRGSQLQRRDPFKYNNNGGQLHGIDEEVGGPTGNGHYHHHQQQLLQQEQALIEQDEENRRQHLNHKVARTRIKAALYEFYRSLEMLKNYKVLNHTGFVKIMKKYDKTAGWKASKIFVSTHLQPTYFMSSGVLNELIAETEDVFVDSFEKGHRRRGMAKLRIPDSKNQTHHLTATRIGLYMGLAAPLLVQALQAAFSDSTPDEIPYWDGLLLIYAGLFITILFGCLFGLNMYVWAKSRINYKFIFEFDPRDNLDFHEYFELPIFFMLLLSLAVYVDFGSKLTAHVATAYWPLILMSIITLVMFCPLPVAYFSSRRWFLSSIGRIIFSGYYRVEFRDFFLADEMNSLSYSIEQFEYAFCAYAHQWTDVGLQCQTSHMWITPFLSALPPWFRLLQCLRRYRDTAEWFPHLVNAGKYTASLLNLFVYFSFRHYGTPGLKAGWIFVSTITSIYTFSWDIYMDWGLFRFGKHGGGAVGRPFLRQELVYSQTWVYYMAIVLDFLGRFSWVARLLPFKNVNVYALSFTLALLEMLRRFQWNFFRLENEHLNNCGQFRAIKDIPLPFHIRVRGESDEEEEEDEDRDNKSEQDEDGEDAEDLENEQMDEMVAVTGGPSNGKGGGTGASALKKAEEADRKNQNRKDYAKAAPRPELSRTSSTMSRRSTSYPESTLQGGNTSGMFNTSTSNISHLSRRSTSSHFAAAGNLADAESDDLAYEPAHPQHHPHGKSTSGNNNRPVLGGRSNTFVRDAVADAGFADSHREALQAEESAQKFYGRRDFDSKIIDGGEEPLSLGGFFSKPLRSMNRSTTMAFGGSGNSGLPASAVIPSHSTTFSPGVTPGGSAGGHGRQPSGHIPMGRKMSQSHNDIAGLAAGSTLGGGSSSSPSHHHNPPAQPDYFAEFESARGPSILGANSAASVGGAIRRPFTVVGGPSAATGNSGPTSPTTGRRRNVSIGTRMKQSIFGKDSSASDDDVTDESDI